METGSDGRIYDSHFDFDRDGKLDVSEYMIYQDTVYGDQSDPPSYKRSSVNYSSGDSAVWKLIKAVFMIAVFALGFFLLIILPPLGAIFMVVGYAIKDSF